MSSRLVITRACIGICALLLTPTSVLAQSWGAEQAANVVVEQVKFERELTRVDAVGTSEAAKSIMIYPAVADEVTAVNFAPGDYVEAGDVLIELDARRQKVAVARATLQLMDAKRNVERLRVSRREGAIPQSELDAAEIEKELIEVDLEEAETNLEDRTVRAPFAGYVGITDIEIGDRIDTNTAITSLDQRNQLIIDFNAPEAAAELLRGKPNLSVQPWQNRSADIPVEIIAIDSRIDPQTRTLRARALMNNSDDLYRPGQSFRVRLQVQGDTYAVVPEAALLWGPDNAYVWVAENNQAKRVEVQIQQRLEGRVLVEADLELGDLLITEGVQTLREGQNLRFAAGSEVEQAESSL